MRLTHSISPDRRTLTIHADESARRELREMPESAKEAAETGNSGALTLHSDAAMFDAFERLLANSELDWIRPEESDDLTDAPILGIRNPNAGEDIGEFEVAALERWGFMTYQVQSVLAALRDTGEAEFTAP